MTAGKLTTSLEDYLESVYMLLLEKRPARVRDIAAELGVTTPSVVNALTALKERGLVSQEPYGSVELTEPGLAAARKVLSRHKLLTAFLGFLGDDEETAETDACKMEHVLSDATVANIAAFLAKNGVEVKVCKLFHPKKDS
ncbi:MAG: metal-dependent transcriptional regulator [Kiritimatiellae bacterium]|nr:metal-dependent transcriptional regulator [Kiritimatiellia bacterium]